ncbi:MAG TPA: acetate/propionate family kinase [Candidatus Limnocylindria bacterium]
MRVLVVNAGSSSLKLSLLDGDRVEPVAQASADWKDPRDEAATFRALIGRLGGSGADPSTIEAVGHRIVHGGTRFTGPVRLERGVVREIEALARYAPLHNPLALRTFQAAQAVLPGVPHVASFDTAFHASLDPASYVYALPYSWFSDWGYRRFGFHGLSVRWALRRSSELLGRPPEQLALVVAHLGAGCSITAVWEGRSASTSMGMTPLEGVVMGTRSGSIDPGIIIAASRDHSLDADALERILDRESGLLGVSGSTSSMRDLLDRADHDDRAALAIEVFVRSIAAGIGAAASALPRLDALVFTGGIGENAAGVRRRVCRRLAAFGVAAPDELGSNADSVIARGAVPVLRVSAREDVVIASEVVASLGSSET